MSLTKKEQRILKFLQDHKEHSYSVQELAGIFNYQGNKTYKKLVKALAYLERIGEIEFLANGRVRAFGQLQTTLTGTYRANDKGYGFVDYEGDSDLFIPPGYALNAMDQDKVEVTVLKQVNPMTGKGSEARVERIIERHYQQLVGEFYAYSNEEQVETGYLGYVIPQGTSGQAYTVFILPEGIEPVDHSIVIVKIRDYPTNENPSTLTGYVAKEIGHRDEPGVDILAILYQLNIPHEFPQNVLEEAEKFGLEINPEDVNGRVDHRNQLVMTIDGADAKDLDDAIALDQLANGNYRLYVHIADVSHYVREGSPIDREAFERGTSVYLTDRVVPMLPQRLSNGICSLHPGVDRLTLTCAMEIDAQGSVVDYQIYPAVINSSYRMTYEAINAIYDGDKALIEEYDPIISTLYSMRDLHHILEAKRHRRGAINFDTTEAIIEVDDQGHPISIKARERGVGERLIESFMLVANETVAQSYHEKELPMIYRVHEQPDADRMLKFAELLTGFGIILQGHVESIQPKQLQRVMQKLKDSPYEEVVSMMLLRSMQQAHYSEESLGHYGLAAKYYTHFTSPIRRYPDLIVHRLVHQYLIKRPNQAEIDRLEQRLPEIAVQSSKRERRSVEAERETDALKKAEYMQDKIGEEFEGMISSITSFGIFVQLPNTVEGLVHLNKLNDDYYQYYPEQWVLIGKERGKVYRIGQSVRIVVDQVNIEEREIDFNIIDAENAETDDLSHLIKRESSSKKKRKSRNQSHPARQRKNTKAKKYSPKRRRRK